MKAARTAWVTGGALLTTWVILGFAFDTSAHLGWLPKWATVISVVAPAAWIGVYTAQGILGPGKWWQSDLGTNMVWLEAAAVFTNGMLAWAVLFNHGMINTPPLAWAYIGGLLAGAAIITWRSLIWLRAFRHEPPLLARVRELEQENAALRAQISGH